MNRTWPRLLSTLALGCLALTPVARGSGSEVEQGDAAWKRRGTGFAESGIVDPRPVTAAVAAYEGALEVEPESLALHAKLAEALWFAGQFAGADRGETKRAFERMVQVTDDAVRLVEAAAGIEGAERLVPSERAARVRSRPGAAEAYFWSTVAWGSWGLSHGYAASARRGVAGRIRGHAETLLALDETFAEAAGPRLLGRLHAVTPKVPLFTGWIDRKQGLALLERAHRIAPENARNRLFLAEALWKQAPRERGRAIALLREVVGAPVDVEAIVEQSEIRDQAAARLREYEEQR